MKYIIVTDVFGRTKALEEFSEKLGLDIEIIDPYHGDFIRFEDETEAYAHFMAQVGIERYSELAFNRLQFITEPISIVAFSVGAAAIWRLSSRTGLQHILTAQCFYGAQIRHHTNITPSFPVELIFPASEPHFSVAALMSKLSDKPNVKITQVPFSHGFMNQHSPNYDEMGYALFTNVPPRRA